MLLTNAQVSRLRKDFANGSSANIKLSRTQLHQIGQSEGFLRKLLTPLLKPKLPLIQNVLKSLAKSVLVPLGLTAATLATDEAIHKEMFGSGNTTLIISNEEVTYIMKIVKSPEGSAFPIKSVSKTIRNEAKKQKIWFLRILLGTLGASLVGNLLTVKGETAMSQRWGTIREGEGKLELVKVGTVWAGQDF